MRVWAWEFLGLWCRDFVLRVVRHRDTPLGCDESSAGGIGLPQAPLKLGNAIFGIGTENNRLFPHRSVLDRGVALSTGCMNAPT